jgi:hypothetical protein
MSCEWFMVVMLSLSFPAPAGTSKSTGSGEVAAIERLLDFSTEPSAKGLKAIEHVYRTLPAATRKKPAVQYAYAIALVRQKRFQEASQVLRELVEEGQVALAVWRAKIWIELELDERVPALTDLEQLGSHAAEHQKSATERLADKDSAEFFGAVCGFLVGPWSHKVREGDAKVMRDRLRALFDDDSRTAFDAAQAKLAERYEKLFKEHEERVQSELAAKTKELDEAKESVGRKAQELGKNQQALKDKQIKRDTQTKTKIAGIDAQLKKIDQQRQSLLQQIAPLEAQRMALVASLMPDNLFFMPRKLWKIEFRTGELNVIQANNQRIRRALTPLITQLNSLEGQVASLNQAELELRAQGLQTEIKHQTDLSKLAEQEQALDKDRKRVKYDAQRLQAKTAATSPRLRAEGAQLTQFATYAPFPVESEKARLLTEVK